MEGLRIVNLENTDIAAWDFAMLKGELEQRLNYYRGMVYTDDSIKSAKEDRSTLNKVKKIIEDARKAYKAKCLAPYDALEPQIKELVSMIEAQRVLLDDTVKEIENRQKAEKENAIKTYYNRKAVALGDLAERLYEKLLNPKWLNASTTKAKYEEGVQMAINNALVDINAIKAMDTPFVDTLIDTYVSTLSMEQVKIKNDELKAAFDKANALSKIPAIAQESKFVANAEDGITLKIFATQSQLNQITDFMKAIGVVYEVQ